MDLASFSVDLSEILSQVTFKDWIVFAPSPQYYGHIVMSLPMLARNGYITSTWRIKSECVVLQRGPTALEQSPLTMMLIHALLMERIMLFLLDPGATTLYLPRSIPTSLAHDSLTLIKKFGVAKSITMDSNTHKCIIDRRPIVVSRNEFLKFLSPR